MIHLGEVLLRPLGKLRLPVRHVGHAAPHVVRRRSQHLKDLEQLPDLRAAMPLTALNSIYSLLVCCCLPHEVWEHAGCST